METKQHIIQNFDKLASSPLRKAALKIVEAGFLAVSTRSAVQKQFVYNPASGILKVQGKKFDLSDYSRIVCVGFGKAALEAVTAIQEILKNKITCGYVLDLKEGNLGNIVCRVGTHPYPTKVNIEATKELVEMLKHSGEKDLVICAVSGGGSALLCYPQDLSCEMEAGLISALIAKGASITELNTVRKHISRVKGGRLAEIIYPAACISLIFSDVPKDNLEMVASGPTVMDTTTNRDAEAVLKKYGALEMRQLPSCSLSETPKDPKYFEKVHNFLFVSAKQALWAMKEEAEILGYGAEIFSESFEGKARELGREIVERNNKGCLLGAGESTVVITGKGKGGRNQEMALSALSKIKAGQVLVCAASDGQDNTEAAGAIVDSFTLRKAKNLRLDPALYLEHNDSFNFFSQTDDFLLTGLTGANVSDFFVCLKN